MLQFVSSAKVQQAQNEIIKCERSGHVLYVEDHLSVANMTMESL